MSAVAALFGIVDLGTWSIRFSINSVQPHHARILPCVFQDRAPIRLYKGLDIPITDTEIKQTIIALKRFCSICSDYGVPPENVRIAANPHEAPNFDKLVDQIYATLKLDVLRLSKEGEHWANAYGVASSVYESRGIYIELRPTYANLYYLNLSQNGNSKPAKSKAEEDEKTISDGASSNGHSSKNGVAKADQPKKDSHNSEALIGPVKVPYLPNTKYRVQPADESGSTYEEARDLMELRDFQHRLTEACNTLSEKAAESNMQSDTVFLSGSGFYGLHTLLAAAATGFGVVTTGLVLQPVSLSQIAVNSRLAHVIQVVGSSLPVDTKRVVYVHHNLRNGLLFQALPPQIRHQDPLIVATKPYALPGAPMLAQELKKALPEQLCPAFIRERLVYAVANSAYIHSSYNLEVQSVSALLVADTGLLSGTHGITHEEKALLGLALCQRWGGDLDETGRNLQSAITESLTEPDLSCWALYLGMVLHLLGAAYPGAHVRPDAVSVCNEAISNEEQENPERFRLIVKLREHSLYGDNIIMATRIRRTTTKLEALEGLNVEVVIKK